MQEKKVQMNRIVCLPIMANSEPSRQIRAFVYEPEAFVYEP